MSKCAKVALLIDTATTWGAGLIEGISEVAHSSADWRLFLGPFGKYDPMRLPEEWDGDGVIARVTSQEMADHLLQRGLPTVNVSWFTFSADKIPRCTCDEVDVARKAVDYFLNRGFRQFAYCGSSIRTNYVDRVAQAFEELLRRHSHVCYRYAPEVSPRGLLPRQQCLARLIDWLRSLPKPIALLAFDSIQARYVTEACLQAEIEVPQDVAVLGGEYDMLSCTVSRPQLSSIDQSPHRVGYAAAELLARLLAGESPPPEPILLPAARVITRQSTDTVAVEDPLLADCVRFIKQRSHERIQVRDILRAVPISRRALEKGFRRHLSRSPAEEIRRVRVERAVTLLCDTDWPMPRIAAACGFERAELLTRAFRRELKTTPSQFRKQCAAGRTMQIRIDPGESSPTDRGDAAFSPPSRNPATSAFE